MNRLSVWGKGEKIEALHVVELGRAKALADLVSDRYFVKRYLSTYRPEKKFIGKSSIWHEVKVVCCLPTPFLHARVITLQCIHVTDNDLADR